MSKRSVHKISSSGSEVAFRNVTGTGALEWYPFHYEVNDPTAGQAHITLNDEVYPTNMSELNSRAGRHRQVPDQLNSKRGYVNTIRFGAVGTEGEEDWCSACLVLFYSVELGADFSVMLDGIEMHND